MSLEERLVGGNILDTYDIVGTNFNYFIYQLERITVRQKFTDAVYIHYRFAVTIISRCLNFVQADFFPHLTGKLIVDCVSGTGGDDTAFDRFTD